MHVDAAVAGWMIVAMKIRRAGEPDIESLVALNAVVQELHVAARPEVFVRPAEGAVAAWFGEVLRNDAARVWIAEFEGEAVGYLLAFDEERPANPFAGAQRWLEIDQVAVVDAARRYGVARRLIEAAIADAEARGMDRFELAAWTFNDRARVAFEKLGFAPKMVRFERRNAPETE